jgi:hypothetical protein
MTTRTFIDKNGNSWEWVETDETVKALKDLHAGNYQEPLYAPHPDLTNGKESD